eukprot:13117660-Alexandrium_andersonii.AAC.1
MSASADPPGTASCSAGRRAGRRHGPRGWRPSGSPGRSRRCRSRRSRCRTWPWRGEPAETRKGGS